MYAPGGVASLIMMNVRVAAHGRYRRIVPSLAAVTASVLLALAGAVSLIEMMYHLTLESANGTAMQLFGRQVDTGVPAAWALPLVLLVAGSIAFWRTRVVFEAAWGTVNAEIEELSLRSAK
jgi:branched-chain amino acid transport system permease protein